MIEAPHSFITRMVREGELVCVTGTDGTKRYDPEGAENFVSS